MADAAYTDYEYEDLPHKRNYKRGRVMWVCLNCGEKIENTFEACWKCGTDRGGTPPPNPEAFQADPEPSGTAFETPCPICGQSAFMWGSLQGNYPLTYKGPDATLVEKVLLVGGHSVSTRLCDKCGNLQLFVRDFLEQPPHI